MVGGPNDNLGERLHIGNVYFMASYLALTGSPLPQSLFGEDEVHSIRLLTPEERIAIEDYYFDIGRKVAIGPTTTALILQDAAPGKLKLPEYVLLAEFAIAVMTASGFVPVQRGAHLSNGKCLDSIERHAVEGISAVLPTELQESAASTWMRCVMVAYEKTKGGLHITADRFTRYCEEGDTPDGLVDLCICLESLIDAEVEIAFRFSACLAKITGEKNARELSVMLGKLYALRSRVVHGADSTKEHQKLSPQLETLRLTARTILTKYVLHLNQFTKEQWKQELKDRLFQ